jgi:hypothetical protein
MVQSHLVVDTVPHHHPRQLRRGHALPVAPGVEQVDLQLQKRKSMFQANYPFAASR